MKRGAYLQGYGGRQWPFSSLIPNFGLLGSKFSADRASSILIRVLPHQKVFGAALALV
jgi:hypothetical protein